jgi:hypothetical protein
MLFCLKKVKDMLCESPVNYVSIPCNISYYYLLMSHESYQLYHGIIVLQYAFSYWSLGLESEL